MKVDLTSKEGSNVISIDVIRQQRQRKSCKHMSIEVDSDLAFVTCRDCGQSVNPVFWIIMLAENWENVRYLYQRYKKAAELYEQKKRTRCQHCRRMTVVNPPEKFDTNLREIPRAT